MIFSPVLAIPDFTMPFIVETDTCDLGIGAVLMQNDKHVAYLSKALGPLHQKLSLWQWRHGVHIWRDRNSSSEQITRAYHI